MTEDSVVSRLSMKITCQRLMFSGVLEFLFFRLKEQLLLQYVGAMCKAWDESHTNDLGFPLMKRSLLV